MPAALALLPLLIGAAGVGTSIYSMSNQPGTPKPTPQTPAQAQTAATNTRNTQEAALSQQLPGLQAQTGGSLSPEALLQLSERLSGQANAPGIGGSVQDMIAKMNGGGSTSPGLTPGGALS